MHNPMMTVMAYIPSATSKSESPAKLTTRSAISAKTPIGANFITYPMIFSNIKFSDSTILFIGAEASLPTATIAIPKTMDSKMIWSIAVLSPTACTTLSGIKSSRNCNGPLFCIDFAASSTDADSYFKRNVSAFSRGNTFPGFIRLTVAKPMKMAKMVVAR